MGSPYRIVKPQRVRAQGGGDSNPQLAAQDYLERLIRLIPAEIVAGYMFVRNLFQPQPGNVADPLAVEMLGWWLPIGGLVLTLASRIFGSRRPGVPFFQSVQWRTVVLAAVAYAAWILNIGNDPLLGMEPDPRLRATILVVVTIIAPLIQQGDDA
jgi:hypothetical protein